MNLLLVALVLSPSAPVAAPEKFLCSSDRWGYTGTVSVYASFAEAKSGRNPMRSSILFPQRDGSIYIARNMGGEYDSYNAILTNWYASTGSQGQGNPNNRNEGFFQMYDNDASNWQNQKAIFTNGLKDYSVEAKGRRAVYPSAENPGDFARLWNAGAPAGSGEATKGTYLEYAYTFKAFGVAGEKVGDVFKNTKNAAGYSGTFIGLFQNESERYPESNGFYVVRLTFNSTSWANSNGLGQVDEFVSANSK